MFSLIKTIKHYLFCKNGALYNVITERFVAIGFILCWQQAKKSEHKRNEERLELNDFDCMGYHKRTAGNPLKGICVFINRDT